MNTSVAVSAIASAARERVRTQSVSRAGEGSSARVHLQGVPLALLLSAATLVSLLPAAAVSDEEIETHGAHEHGIATLNIALEANRIELEFQSPSINVLGFEHAPRTDRERAAVAAAEERLGDGRGLFVLTPAAECQLRATGIDSPTWDDHSGHADYESRYLFECSKPQRLRSIDVRLVTLLTANTRVRVQLVGSHTQTATELTATSSIVRIP